MGSQPNTEEILEKFVLSFVIIFEGYFDEYHKRLIEKIPKKGKTADNLVGAADILTGVTEILEGPIKAAAVVTFEVFRKTAGVIGSKCNRDDLKKLSNKLRDFKKRPDDIRNILIESGSEIFRSFEGQFTRLMADDNSWETAIEKVAEDAVNRIIYQLRKTPGKDLSAMTILEGVLFGESKKYRSPNSDFPNLHTGHSVIIDDLEIKTSDLFKKVGLIRDSDYYRYKSKTWGLADLNRIGFRLLYTWEDVDTYSNYTKLNQAPPDKYKHILTDEILQRVKHKTADQLKESQTTVNLGNILEDMKNEASKATEELMDLLKQNADAVDKISGEFTNINESLNIIQQATSKSNELAEVNRDILLDLQVRFDNLNISRKTDQGPVIFDVMEPTELFKGRINELEQLDKSLQRGDVSGKKSVFSRMVCLSGLGGIGKSEMAKRYISDCRRNADYILSTYSNFIWINAENEASLTNSFHRLAEEELGIEIINGNGKPKDIKLIVKDVYESLKGRNESLVILDNAENREYLRPFLPLKATEGNLPYFLLTSRDTEWDKRIEKLHLEGMKMEEAEEFVKDGLEYNNEGEDVNIKILVEKLQYFPLAIQQAISYILVQKEINENFTVGHYLKEFNEKTQEMLSSEEFKTLIMDNTYSKTTFTTWNITVGKILSETGHGKLAVDIMNIMAYLSPDNIDREIFFKLPLVSEDDVRKAVRLLVKYSMAKGEFSQSVLRIHRLVQQVTRIKLGIDGKKTVIEAVKMLLKSNFPEEETSESYTTKKKILPHLEAFYVHLKDWVVRKPEDQEKIERNFLIELLLDIANACTFLGKSWRAKQVYEDALAIVRKRSDKDDLIAAAIISVLLCPVLDDLGEYKEQLTTTEEALPILEEYYNGDTRFANALEKKAAALAKLGECVLSEETYKTILRIHESSGNALNIATTKLNLSAVYALKNDVQKQKEMLEEAIPVFEKNYSSDHVKLATAMFQLASVHRVLSERDTEIELLEKCLPVYMQVLGEEAQVVGRLLLVLGVAYGSKGDQDKNKEYCERALHILKNHYRDEHHIEVARCKTHVADAIGASGDKPEKLKLLMSALADYEKFHDGGSWETAYLLVRVAEAHDEMGRREDTKKALETAITMMENHPRDDEKKDRDYINGIKNILTSKYSDV